MKAAARATGAPLQHPGLTSGNSALRSVERDTANCSAISCSVPSREPAVAHADNMDRTAGAHLLRPLPRRPPPCQV